MLMVFERLGLVLIVGVLVILLDAVGEALTCSDGAAKSSNINTDAPMIAKYPPGK